MKKNGLVIMAGLLFVFGMFSVVRTRPIDRLAAPSKQPPVASYHESIAGVGMVEANTENVSLGPPVSGLCTQVYVKAGDNVVAGQKLFSLDDRDLRAELEVRKRELEAARAQLGKLRNSPRPEEVPLKEAKVAEAEQAVADAKVQQQLMESVTDRRAIREEDLQRRRIATKSALARLNQAQAELALLKAGAWSEDIKVAEAQVTLAEKEVQRVQTDINRLTVTAPFDGQVLQSSIHAGEYSPAGTLPKPLMLFGNVNVLNVRVDVDEHEAWKLHRDAQAYATVRGNTAIRVPLQFVRFEPYVTPKKSLTGDSTERVDTRVMQVIYAVTHSDGLIHVGQQMDVYIDGSAIRLSSKNAENTGVSR
jgi:HlyD family secretion protein